MIDIYEGSEILILKMIEEIKSLNKEIIGLKHYIRNNCPFNEQISDDEEFIPKFTLSRQYEDFCDSYDFDLFRDDVIYLNQIRQLQKDGHSKDGYPKSIRE